MGYIYCIENTQNNKKYIGQTKRKDIWERWDEHIENWKNGCHTIKMQRAYDKYGLENFDFYIIEEVDDIKLLNERELYYQKLYNTIEDGYNTIEGSFFERKRVYCYDFDGNYLNLSYESVSATVKALGIDETLIFNICNGTRYKKTATGKDKKVYRFSYTLVDKLPPVVYERFTKHIAQYDSEWNFIKEWNSIADAAEFYTGNRRNTSLFKYFSGQRSHAFGFQWERLQ